MAVQDRRLSTSVVEANRPSVVVVVASASAVGGGHRSGRFWFCGGVIGVKKLMTPFDDSMADGLATIEREGQDGR
jgi:hypothetical protein